MCELPARSMPGSEILFVEKTSTRGAVAPRGLDRALPSVSVTSSGG